ncbi:MAG: ABC transporter substrate-binding protein [archaeon]
MRNIKQLIVFFVLFLLLLAGCAKTEQAKTQEQISDRSLLNVKERGKLRVGIDFPYDPMELYTESGKEAGIDVEIIQEIATDMGVSLEMIDYDWDEMFAAVKSGEIDLAISSITITSERSEEMLFSVPYFNGGQVMVIRKGYEEIKSVEDLKNKKVGVLKDTTGEEAAMKYVNQSLLVNHYLDSDDIISELKNKSVDVMINDYIAGVNFVKKEPSLMIAGEPFTQEFYGIATKLGNDALMDEINMALRDMKRTGKLNEIKDKWLK